YIVIGKFFISISSKLRKIYFSIIHPLAEEGSGFSKVLAICNPTLIGHFTNHYGYTRLHHS
ncbi:MAG: hypothetical protein ACOC4M_11450, partial [Promethearchaeia archaeon]